jgi:cystathionine gamma-synthase
MAAATAILQAMLPGDHLILPDDVYHGIRLLVQDIFVPWGLDYSLVDLTNPEALEAALTPRTRLVWIETPSNPLLKITDIQEVVRQARTRNCRVVVDGAWTTPLLQLPLSLGADFVIHSVTKYLAGHSDVLGGAVIARKAGAFFERIRQIQISAGAVMDPFGAWLALRGMRSLTARLQLQCRSARSIAEFLDQHPAVERVHFPGLKSHPGHPVAAKQMRDFGGMLSFEAGSSAAAALSVAAATRIFKRATSLGGTESLIEHRASIEAPPTLTPLNLLRLSIGLEHVDDLLADLDQALGQSIAP